MLQDMVNVKMLLTGGAVFLGRLERYKEIRQNRRKIKSSIFLFFLVLVSGTCTADYAVNSLMKNEKRIEIIRFENRHRYYEISLLNKRLYIDTESMKNDFMELWNVPKRLPGLK